MKRPQISTPKLGMGQIGLPACKKVFEQVTKNYVIKQDNVWNAPIVLKIR